VKSGSSKQCIDVAILAEGYTQSEMNRFYEDAQTATDAIFTHEPFKRLKGKFNVVAVASPSNDSGVSEPGDGKWRNTAFDSHFNTFYSDRYLTTSSVKKIHETLNGIPYEHIIILANTDTYGGGGIYNSYTLTTAHHVMFKPVVVHEFGHSFAGLADEYAYDEAESPQYPYTIEPWEQNITTMVNFKSKWKDMLDAKIKGVGLYEGAGYTKKGIYRPAYECRMRINETSAFCPVCQRAIEKLIRFYTDD
jgi:IgA Peptidase M64.